MNNMFMHVICAKTSEIRVNIIVFVYGQSSKKRTISIERTISMWEFLTWLNLGQSTRSSSVLYFQRNQILNINIRN